MCRGPKVIISNLDKYYNQFPKMIGHFNVNHGYKKYLTQSWVEKHFDL